MVDGRGRAVGSGQLRHPARGEVSWIRQALLHICPPPKVWVEQFDRLNPAQQLSVLERVRTEWITDEKTRQIPQFSRSRHKMHAAAARWRQFGLAFATLGWASLVAMLIVGVIAPLREVAEKFGLTATHPGPWILVISGIKVIVGGLLIAYCERCASRIWRINTSGC